MHICAIYEQFADMAEDAANLEESDSFQKAKYEVLRQLEGIDDQLGEILKYIELDDYVKWMETETEVKPMVSAAHELMSDTTFRSEVRDIFRDLFKDSFVVEKASFQTDKETGIFYRHIDSQKSIADLLEDISVSLSVLSGRR